MRAWWLVGLLLAWLSGCVSDPAPSIPPQAASSLSGPSFDTSGLHVQEATPEPGPRLIHILHTNDMHGQVKPRKDSGGVYALGAYVAKVREEVGADKVILLDSGDIFTGTPEGSMTKGALMIDLMNALRYDAMALGNHEFDLGMENLLLQSKKAQFPILSANIAPKDNAQGKAAEGLATPLTIIERGGFKVGIVGLITTDTPHITHKDAGEAFHFSDLEIPTNKALQTLKGQGVDFSIVLTHVGIEEEKVLAGKLSSKDVPILLGGHSHTLVEELWRSPDSGVGYLQTGSRLQGISHAIIQIGEDGPSLQQGEVVRLPPSDDAPDPVLAEVVGRYSPEIEKVMGQKLGNCPVPLDRRAEGMASSPLGNFVTDVMRARAKADVAFQNKSGIRSDVPAGEVTMREMFEVEPFGNTITNVKLTGQQLLEVLEHASQEGRHNLEVSGATIVFDLKGAPGKRVAEVKIGGAALNPKKVYTVATNSFLADGGDEQKFTLGQKQNTGILLREALVEQMSKPNGCTVDQTTRIKTK